jgi:hypothetical protein
MPPGCPLRAVLYPSWLRSELVNSDAIGGQIECKWAVKWSAISQGIPAGIPTQNQNGY